jgi:hypothetical protein
MMNQDIFFKIIDKVLKKTSIENILHYDEVLIKELMQKQNKEIAQFHLCLLELRRKLDTFEINKVARSMDFASSREVFNRFCNGIIASGQDFYNKSKEETGFLIHKLQENSTELKHLYYEGLSLVSSAAFYEKNGLGADWDGYLRNEKRLLEVQVKNEKSQELER